MADEGETTTRFLLDILDQTMPIYRIKKRLRDCVSFYYSGDLERSTDTVFPILLLVCPTLTQLISPKRYTRGLLKKDDNPQGLHIRFSTIEKIAQFGVNAGVWEEA